MEVKTSPVAVALLAVASSLAAVGTIELLRGPRPASEPPPDSSAALAPRGVEPLVPEMRALDPSLGQEDRLAELERRVAALELSATSRREPVTSDTQALSPGDDLRDLVLDVVAEDRETRRRAEELEGEEDLRKELEFTALQQAHSLAQEHGLVLWQQKILFELFLEIETRRAEVGEDMNPLKADPEEFERRWAEFDAWADQRYVEGLARHQGMT